MEYPEMIFAVASNHISMVKESLRYLWILEMCKVILISWDCGYEKPSKEFYELLIKRIWHNAEEILFIDDQEENIQNAENFGLKAIYYQKNTILSETILSYLSKIE